MRVKNGKGSVNMFYGKTKLLSNLVIILGIFLTIYGVWQYTFYSDFSRTVSVVKAVVFPVIGVSLMLIGYLFSRFIREVKEEMDLIRSEISKELKKLKSS
jgi:di/tricarboxylate transporter